MNMIHDQGKITPTIAPETQICIKSSKDAMIAEVTKLKHLLKIEKEKRMSLEKKSYEQMKTQILDLNARVLELQMTTKDPEMRRLLPKLPTLFPISENEAARLNEISQLKLFTSPRPISAEIEFLIDAHLGQISGFPIEAVIFEAMGLNEYRTLAGRIMQTNKNGEKILTNILETNFDEFGHRKLGGCQYVINEIKTMSFSDKEIAPFIETLQQHPQMFENLAVWDPQLRKCIENSKRRKAWTALMDALTKNKMFEDLNNAKICNIFEYFVFQGCNYIGTPVKSNGYAIGTLFFLHKNSSETESLWKEQSEIEYLALAIENCLKKLHPENEPMYF